MFPDSSGKSSRSVVNQKLKKPVNNQGGDHARPLICHSLRFSIILWYLQKNFVDHFPFSSMKDYRNLGIPQRRGRAPGKSGGSKQAGIIQQK
jgi:hypothetical protein